MNIIRAITLAAGLLFITACSDETQLSEDVLESNFCLPCGELKIRQTRWNADLNVLVVELSNHPGSHFETSLRERGWKYLRDKPYLTYVKDNMFLERHGAEKKIVIRSSLYLRKDGGKVGEP